MTKTVTKSCVVHFDQILVFGWSKYSFLKFLMVKSEKKVKKAINLEIE